MRLLARTLAALALPEQSTAGTLAYRCYLRLFGEDGPLLERSTTGSLPLAISRAPSINHPITMAGGPLPNASYSKTEVELSWRGTSPLVLLAPPRLS